MNSDDIYKFIGYTVAVLFFIYVFAKSLRFQTKLFEPRGIIEGMTVAEKKNQEFDQEKLKDDLQTYKDMIQDQKDILKLYKPEYKDTYKQIIESMHDLTEYRLIRSTIAAEELIRDKNETAECIEKMDQMNKQKEFLITLDYIYTGINNLSSNN
jgi:hypothetical protein